MKKFYFFIILWMFAISVWAQKVVHPTEIKHPVGFAVIESLKNKPIVTDFRSDTSEFYFNKHEDRKINPDIHPPKDFDAIYQGQFQSTRAVTQTVTPEIIINFDGQESPYYPPDANGTVNENYYFQVVNTTYAIYDKQGNILAGPSDLNSIFDSSLPGAGENDGDPIVLWDEQANKWFYAEFSLSNRNDYMLIAVSQTDDPTGAWWSWSFDVDDTPDYMKFGIWQDGYYMATNTSNGNDVYVFERDKMLVGDANPTMIGFDNPNRPETFDRFHCILPLDNDGDWAPTGTPGQFITIADDNQNNPDDELWIYEMDVDWNTPSNSTFQRTQTLTVSSFVGNFDSSWDNIPQPGTDQELDAISTVLMFRANYRNFNGDQRLVVTHTIAESEDEAAIRWYELQNNGNTWAIRQEGNINPDNVSRWNASIAINANKEIGIGFSVSDGNNTYPGIRIMGQTADENANATGVMNVEETVVLNGGNSQTGAERWGDYCNISVDPTDGRSFWYTNEYIDDNGHRQTKIVAFKFPDDCIYPDTQASDFQADAQSETQIDLTWTRGDGDQVIVVAKQDNAVDADPQDGTSYIADAQFGNGDEIGNGNYVVYTGTGTSVSITGLSASTTYHFAVYEYNDTDFCYLTPAATVSAVTYGLATVETRDMVDVNMTDAQGEGEVISENGSPVTERGLCWSTSQNPTTADTHASNGTGVGTYTVDLTGLSANTTYYVRAYAINSVGTSYGDNVTFTTDSGLPEVTTNSVSSITTAVAEGEVTDEGSSSVTERGICWSTSPNPTTTDTHASNGTGTGTYTVNLTGLTANTTYYVRAYAINSEGTSYGDNITFTTENDMPEVVTSSVSSITTDAVAEGEVTDEGSSSVTERGICWSTSPNPTTADTHDSNGTGIGTYSVNLTGLTSNTTYYVRAYAINSSGTSYGDNISFTTAPDAGDCVMIADYPYLQTFDNWTTSNPGDTCTPDGSVPLEECWENVSGDDSDWDIYSGATPTSRTGPSDDITGGGNYIYMESTGCGNKTASIITPHFNFSDVGYPLMYFYAHMYRRGRWEVGTLEVYYSTDNGANWVDLNEFSGDQGDAWFQVYNDLGFLKGEADVIFKFTIITNSEYSDIAIDHFEIIDNLYCPTEGSIQYDTATTAVQFNTINNADGGKTESYADYTNINTTVQRSQSYDLTARVDTDGNYTVYTKVWIDWNQDYDFDDPGEEYDLGDATDVSDGATSNSPLSVLVPADAVLGKTRMRVSTKYGEYATACETDFDGEVEDYTIFVSTEDCSNVAFWKNSQWTDEDENVLATTDLTDRLLFIDEILITNGTDIDACSMIISKNTSLIISASDEVKLTNDVYNEGQILIENTGALIQTEDDAMVEGDGEYEMQIQSQPMNNYYDYGFWTAPIESFTLGGIVPNAWGYYAFNPAIQNWEVKDASTVMEKGVSYAVSAPEGFTGGTINVTFKQDNTKFNAGDVLVPLTVNGTGAQDDDDANLVGNPYPSAIDFDKVASNNTNIQGAYYVWTNCAGLDADGHHQPSGFAVYSTGSGSTAACEGESNEVNIDQYIASGQGFYVEANASGNLVFKNSQRVTANNTFVNRTGVYDRVWLDFSNNAGFSQTLVGFFDNATDQLDRLYDAHLFDKSSMSLYSLSGKDKLIIQGLSSWDDETREVPLGFNTVAGGSHTISLHEAEGVLRGDVNIYLKDLYESKIIDLKQNAYDFSAEQGNYDDRFVLIFTRSALKVDPIKSLEHVNILSEQPVFIAVSDEENIEQVDIYVLSGKKILSYKAQQPEKRISMNLKSVPHQVLIFKISLKNQKTVTIKSVR